MVTMTLIPFTTAPQGKATFGAIVVCSDLLLGCTLGPRVARVSPGEMLLLTPYQWLDSWYLTAKLVLHDRVRFKPELYEHRLTGIGRIVPHREGQFMIYERWDL